MFLKDKYGHQGRPYFGRKKPNYKPNCSNTLGLIDPEIVYLLRRCRRAEPAKVLVVLLVLPLFNALLATFPTRFDVFGAFAMIICVIRLKIQMFASPKAIHSAHHPSWNQAI